MSNAAETRDDHGRGNALAWFQSIVEMVDAWRAAEAETSSDLTPHDRIIESVLSVEVRSGWHGLGETLTPAEYMILLSTGGPALRLIGELDENSDPESVQLEYQDWGTPWTKLSVFDIAVSMPPLRAREAQDYLLDFARQFYFGE